MTQLLQETYLDYSDILVKPKMGNNLNSRKDVNLVREYKFKFGEVRKGLGVFNANMVTVGNFATAKKLLAKGMFATIHKFYTAEEIMNFYKECESEGISTENLFISIGIRKGVEELNKLKELRELGWLRFRNICIDCPNMYIPKSFEVLKTCREEFPESVIMCGNVASSDILTKLSTKADIIKIGIGSGSACKTRLLTSVGVPMASLILETADIVHANDTMICADGGLVEIGDICKAFCLNADFVMSGSLFAGTDEAEGDLIEKQYKSDELAYLTCRVITKKYKLYYGMSSTLANNKFAGGLKDYKASEGRQSLVPYTGSLDKILQDICGGVASCCTYIGAKSVKDMSKCATLIKVNHTVNTIFASTDTDGKQQ